MVKTDPVTGVDHPFATVHVEDTDCNFFGVPPPLGAPSTTEHWHTGQFDNTVVRTATFTLPFAPDNQGAYSFSVSVWSRAFNPSDPTGYTVDWNNYHSAFIRDTLVYLPIAEVNS